jgi:hypothetical protein
MCSSCVADALDEKMAGSVGDVDGMMDATAAVSEWALGTSRSRISSVLSGSSSITVSSLTSLDKGSMSQRKT